MQVESLGPLLHGHSALAWRSDSGSMADVALEQRFSGVTVVSLGDHQTRTRCKFVCTPLGLVAVPHAGSESRPSGIVAVSAK